MDFDAGIRGDQVIDAHFPRLAVLLQIKPLSKKGLQHQFYLFPRGASCGSSVDIVLILVKPARPRDLIGLQMVCLRYQALQRSVSGRDSSGRIYELIVIVRSNRVLIQLDRGDVELRFS
jgi:hypothetical protein